MQCNKLVFLILTAFLLVLLASCNKPATDDSDASAVNPCAPEVLAQTSGGTEGSSSVLPPTEDQPCATGAGEQSDGAASARSIADFKVRHASGEVKPISEFYGKPLVINFWGDWCAPCIEELPAMDAVYRERKDEFDMIAVSVDSKAAEDFWKANAYEIPLYHDVDGRSLLGLTSIPTTFFMDREGKVVGFLSGSMSREDFEVRLKTILH